MVEPPSPARMPVFFARKTHRAPFSTHAVTQAHVAHGRTGIVREVQSMTCFDLFWGQREEEKASHSPRAAGSTLRSPLQVLDGASFPFGNALRNSIGQLPNNLARQAKPRTTHRMFETTCTLRQDSEGFHQLAVDALSPAVAAKGLQYAPMCFLPGSAKP